jgi:hypothetical protein
MEDEYPPMDHQRDDKLPSSQPMRKRYLVVLVLTLLTVATIVGVAVGVTRPNQQSSKASSNSNNNLDSTPEEDSSPSSVSSPTGASSNPPPVGGGDETDDDDPSSTNAPPPSPTMPVDVSPPPSAGNTARPATASPFDSSPRPSPSIRTSPPTVSPPVARPTLDSPRPSDAGGNPTIQKCLDLYQCQVDHSDRYGNGAKIPIGHSLCNDNMRLGITKSGVFQWNSCDTGETKIIHEDTTGTVAYFIMSSTGVLSLMDSSDNVVWKKEPIVSITFTSQCLRNPVLDCPYMYVQVLPVQYSPVSFTVS